MLKIVATLSDREPHFKAEHTVLFFFLFQVINSYNMFDPNKQHTDQLPYPTCKIAEEQYGRIGYCYSLVSIPVTNDIHRQDNTDKKNNAWRIIVFAPGWSDICNTLVWLIFFTMATKVPHPQLPVGGFLHLAKNS